MAKRRRRRRPDEPVPEVEDSRLVEVLWDGELVPMDPAAAEVADQIEDIHEAAEACGLRVVPSLIWGRAAVLQLRFDRSGSGERALDWWPGDGEWSSPAGSVSGKCGDWRQVLEIAALRSKK